MPSFTGKTDIIHFSAPNYDQTAEKINIKKDYKFGLSQLAPANKVNYIIDLEDKGLDENGVEVFSVKTRTHFFSSDFAKQPNIQILQDLVFDAFENHRKYFHALHVNFPVLKNVQLPLPNIEVFVDELKKTYAASSLDV